MRWSGDGHGECWHSGNIAERRRGAGWLWLGEGGWGGGGGGDEVTPAGVYLSSYPSLMASRWVVRSVRGPLASQNDLLEHPDSPSKDEMVLNILHTRVMLPTEPDYGINWLPAFMKEACGTRDIRG